MKIGVVGSINVDMVYKMPSFLKMGETKFGFDFQIHMGGKGANQAVMLSALNDDVVFLGAVGEDSFAEDALTHLKNKNIDVQQVSRKKANTGLAIIQLVDGDNSIAVIPGANILIETREVDAFLNNHPDLRLVVTQLETNLDIVEYLIRQCKLRNIPVILNPAPAAMLSRSIIDDVAYLIPNESETELLFNSTDFARLVEDHQGKLIITMGSHGVMYFDGTKAETAPSQSLKVVDTTGAGDSFVAGFATGILHQRSLRESVEFGIQIASLTCMNMGAQGAYEQTRSLYHEKTWNLE